MTRVPAIFENLLTLPVPVLIGFLVAWWGGFALLVHRVLVPWIAGPHGRKLGRLEAEVPAQIGLAFGLLISFIAMPIWEQHGQAESAAQAEAAAYREMHDAVLDATPEAAATIAPRVRECVDFMVHEEWPQMPRLESPRVAAPPLRSLRHAIHGLSDESTRTELRELLRVATEARETRLRIAVNRPPPARWSIVGTLAILTLLGVGLIHAESYRARRIALSMVAVGISCCFVLLLAYTRPYLGQFAVKPDDLVALADDLAADTGALAAWPLDTATPRR